MKNNSSPTISNLSLSFILAACVFVGFIIGVFVRRIPYINLDPKVNMGDFFSGIIAFLSLLTAIFVLPYFINRQLSKKTIRENLVVSDLDELYLELKNLRSLYASMYHSNKVVKQSERKSIIEILTNITNLVKELSLTIKSEGLKVDFDDNVKDVFNDSYILITENLIVGKKIREDDYLNSTKSLNKLMANIKKCRYRTYSK